MFTKGVVEEFNKDLNGNDKYFIELDVESIAALQSDKKKEAEKDKVKMEGLNVLMMMPLSEDARVSLLVSEFGYTEKDAKVIATKPIVSNEGE